MNKSLQKLGLLFLAGGLWLGSGGDALGQTAPTPQTLPFNQNFNAMEGGTTLPEGIKAWLSAAKTSKSAAETATPTADAPIVATTSTQTSGGSVYNYSSNGNSRIYIQLTANSTNGANILAAAINTTGKRDVVVAYDVELINDQPRSAGTTLQYRIGETGAWVTVPETDYSSVGLTAETIRNFSVTLPDETDNKPVVQLRWVTYEVVVTGASGSRDGIAFDNININGTAIADDVTAPTALSFSPQDNATGVATTSDLSLTFSENVSASTGNIILRTANGAVAQTIAASSAKLVVNGNVATIDVDLQAGESYYVEIEASAFKDAANNAFAGITGNSTWNFSTAATATPVISASASSLTFAPTVVGATSTAHSFDVSGTDLTANLVVSVTGDFQISKTNGSFGSSALTFTPAELATAQKVYVRYSPTALNATQGSITVASTGAENVTVALTGSAYSPFAQDFSQCGTELPGGWSQFSVSGAQIWGCTTFGRSGNGVQMNGYAGGNRENEDWLISPALDLSSGFTYPLLSFWSRTAFAGNSLKLMVSTNYSGTGSPNAAGVTWTELQARFPAAQTDQWTESKDIDLSAYKAANVHIAFVYTSTTSAAARWTVDDFSVINSTTPPAAYLTTSLGPLADADFGRVSAGQTVDKQFTFSVVNLSSAVTLEAPENFQLSKNGTDFASTIQYTQAEAATTQTFTVRFVAPAATDKAYAGQIRFRSDNLDVRSGYLTGAVLNTANTLDVVTWNIEWFGSAGQQPEDVTQMANVKKVLETMDADVYGFQEISSKEAFDQLVASLPDYEGFVTETSGQQETAFMYKKAVVKKVSSRALLSGVTGINGFWASGRYPQLLEADVTLNGVTKRIHFLNIHAKANENASEADALEAYNRRKEDVRILKDTLDQYFPNANIIMLGDYNDDIDFTVASISSTTESTYKVFVDDVARYQALTMPLSQAGLRSYVERENVIDHMIVSNELAGDYIANSARIHIPFSAINATQPEQYTSTTSDHLPTVARFTLSAGPLVTFEQGTTTQAENVQNATLNLRLSKAVATEQTVNVTVTNKTSVTYGATGDYTTTPAVNNGVITVTIPANATTAAITVTLINDTEVEEKDTVVFQLSSTSSMIGIGAANTHTFIIESDDVPLGIKDEFAGGFELYPNPTTGQVTLKLPAEIASKGKINLTLYSLQGDVLLQAVGNEQALNARLSRQLQVIPAGMYLVKVQEGDKINMTRVVKQ